MTYLIKQERETKVGIFFKIVDKETNFILHAEVQHTNDSFEIFVNNFFSAQNETLEYIDLSKQIAKIVRKNELDNSLENLYIQIVSYPELGLELDLNNLFVDEYFNLN